jgi:hypothetical protein
MATIGDNSGELTEAQKIAANLAEKYPQIIARANEILNRLEKTPAVIATKDESDKVSEFIRVCMTFDSVADDTRDTEKRPYWDAGKAVDGFFNNLRAIVSKVRDDLKARAKAYDVKMLKEEEERRKKAADLLREEAEILAAKAKTPEQEMNAKATMMDARDAEAAIAVKPAELTRTRTATGVTRSLTVIWKHEVTDPKKVPKKYLAPSAALIDAAIKAATTEDRKCDLEIPGVRIYPDYDSRVR